MSFASTDQRPSGRLARLRLGWLFVVAIVLAGCVIAYTLYELPTAQLTLARLGAVALLGFLAVLFVRHFVFRRQVSVIADALEHDKSASIITNRACKIVSANAAAKALFADSYAPLLAVTLRTTFADPQTILNRLTELARSKGFVRDDLMTHNGALRLSAQYLGNGCILWRIEDNAEPLPEESGYDTLPMPVLTTDTRGCVLAMNAAARSLLGTRAKILHQLFPDGPIRPNAAHQVITEKGPREFHVLERSVDNARTDLFLMQLSDLPGNGIGIEAFPVAMLTLDGQGTILKANSAATALLSQEDVEGHALSDLMEGLGRPVSSWIEDTARRLGTTKSEFLRLTRTDREAFVQVTLSPARHDGQDRLIAFLADATELKTLEAQFVQSQQMQAIGQLAGGVAHDFNNLLTAISGHCDLMLLRHDPGDEDYADLMQITQNANRAASLVGQLLAFSRKQTLSPEILDVRDTLSDLTHLLNRLVGEKVTLTLSHDQVLGSIRADKRQLEQVLMNLVVNARDAMPDGGEIRIITQALTLTEPLERDRVRVPPGDYVSVKGGDEGTGIPGDKLQKVFEPFFTTKRTGEGTGLGLSTAYGIVKQTGGYIFVDSTLGEGTCFSLVFPVRLGKEASAPETPSVIKKTPPKHGEGVVLLVEDEAPVRAFAARALRLRGYTVIEASCAEEALEMLETDDVSVDAFVTDVVMPGMDGPTWVRKALKKRPDVRVVFMSGYAESAFGDAEPNLKNSVFLQKPFSLNQLTETVHDQIAAAETVH